MLGQASRRATVGRLERATASRQIQTLNDDDIFGIPPRDLSRSTFKHYGGAARAKIRSVLNDEEIFGGKNAQAGEHVRDLLPRRVGRAPASLTSDATAEQPHLVGRDITCGRRREECERKPPANATTRKPAIREKKLPSRDTPSDNDSLDHRNVQLSTTKHGLPRICTDISAMYRDTPWPGVCSRCGVMSLAEMCYRRAVQQPHRFGFLGDLPDEVMYMILLNATANDIERVESSNPGRSKVCDAAWGRLCKKEYGTEELPQPFMRWKTYFRAKEKEREDQIKAAGERLRQKYREEVHNREKKAIAVLPRPPAAAARAVKSRRTSALSPIQKLRLDMRTAFPRGPGALKRRTGQFRSQIR